MISNQNTPYCLGFGQDEVRGNQCGYHVCVKWPLMEAAGDVGRLADFQPSNVVTSGLLINLTYAPLLGLWCPPPARLNFGNSGPNSLTGPGFAQMDHALHKSLPLWSDASKLKFRVEVFNISNTTNYERADSAITDGGSFGAYRPALVYPSRQVQPLLLISSWVKIRSVRKDGSCGSLRKIHMVPSKPLPNPHTPIATAESKLRY
jgi:hypothetical protein